jgi:hypothetical protein
MAKLINSEGRVTLLPSLGIEIGDKIPVEVTQEQADIILLQEKTVRLYDEPDKKPKNKEK